MLHAQDLMVDDWISTPKGYAKVIALDKWGITAKTKYNDEIDSSEQDENFEPIPLTPEILEKNGLRKLDNLYVEHDDYFSISLLELSDSIWLFRYKNTEIYEPPTQVIISHLHELRHCLKFARIEKEITL